MVANSRSTPARIGATALLHAACHGLSGRLRRAWYMIRGSMPRARRPARRSALSYALSAYSVDRLGQRAEGHLAGLQLLDDPDQVRERAPQPVQLPDDQDVAAAQIGEARLEAGTVVASAGCAVLVQVPLVDAGGEQGVPLQV